MGWIYLVKTTWSSIKFKHVDNHRVDKQDYVTPLRVHYIRRAKEWRLEVKDDRLRYVDVC